ncbi:hypothetical protein [Chitinophaga sp.]|uniref:alpha/beta hydrolase family protein n=1 Tax=Chitinophaga sp. TaxID=1869181 RepID=UPI00261E5C54|nr:hypothetical protein [uncultured Chitinophaga sp.]
MRKKAILTGLQLMISCALFAQEKPFDPADYETVTVRSDKPAVFRQEVQVPVANDSFRLKGVFTRPGKDGKHPAILLLPGSVNYNLDAAVFPADALEQIAQRFAEEGFAVLYYDDRPAAVNGSYATIARDAADVLRELRSFPQVDPRRTGIVAHNTGAAAGLMVAAQDTALRFFVPMAAQGAESPATMAHFMSAVHANKDPGFRERVAREGDVLMKIAGAGQSRDSLLQQLKRAAIGFERAFRQEKKIPDNAETGYALMLIQTYSLPEMTAFAAYRPALYMDQVKCPVLAVFGGNDELMAPSVHSAAWQRVIPSATIQAFPGMNHYLSKSGGKQPSDSVLKEIAGWMQGVVKTNP